SKKDHPIVDLSYIDVLAYCKWAGTKLPTEAQWEKAASWDVTGKKKLKFPWGDEFDTNKLCCSLKTYGDAGGTKPVGSFPGGASPYGLLEMAGNVSNWCSGWFESKFNGKHVRLDRNGETLSVGDNRFRVSRGGSWYFCVPVVFQVAYREICLPEEVSSTMGFRCVSGP
ncbi:MAG: SUMF1/EgtB/PvdO family nonheme iron enzyme, partial [Chthonomonadales bacterium]